MTNLKSNRPEIEGLEYQNQLGEGGFGSVWHFYDPEYGRDIALKRLTVAGGVDAEKVHSLN